MTTKRSFLQAMLAAAVAPAFVKASSLSPIYVPRAFASDFGSRIGMYRADLLATDGSVAGRLWVPHSQMRSPATKLTFHIQRAVSVDRIQIEGAGVLRTLPFRQGVNYAIPGDTVNVTEFLSTTT